jgi:tight adherence protein C
MPTTWVIVGGSAFVGLLMIVLGMMGPREEESVEDRLARLGTLERPPTLEEIELSTPFAERVLRPQLERVAEFIERLSPEQTLARSRRRLELAGVGRKMGAAQFLLIRYILTAVFGAGAVVFAATSDMEPFKKFLAIPILTVFGNFLPVLLLVSRTQRRQKEIVRALPDVMDLLTICVEAGLGFDAAMDRVVEKWDNELVLGFQRVLQQIRLGKTRRESLRDMADSMDVPDVSTFVAAVIQAEELGVSIAKILRIQSDQMRVRRRQRAEEEARKAPVKISLPTVLLILPALLIVILGPAILMLIEIFTEQVDLGL